MVPRTPQQNGKAERLNRTLGEISRCIRLNAGLPKVLRVETINMSFYIMN